MSKRSVCRRAHVILAAVGALALLATTLVPDADARQTRRGKKHTFARYADSALADSLMSSFSAPGVVVLDRDFVRFSKGNEDVEANVTYERVVFVRDPEALAEVGSGLSFSMPDYPGHEIDKMEAVRISGSDHKSIDVAERKVAECALHKKQRDWVVEFGDVKSGDMLCVKVEYKIQGANPRFAHMFDSELPVVQTDVTFEVPNDLVDGKASRAFNWWAGSWPSGIAQDAWERPRAWRFRWGERDVPALAAGDSPRLVGSTWVFDPRLLGASLERQELKATGGSDIGYTGPTLSAKDLSGQWVDSDDATARRSMKPTTASLGSMSWELAADRLLFLGVGERLDDTRGLSRTLDKLVAKQAPASQVVDAVAAFVSGEIATAPIALDRSFPTLKRPGDVVKRSCATKLDKVVAAAALLRSRGIDAYPVLLTSGAYDRELVSASIFDDVCLRVDDAVSVFVDVDTGQVTDRLDGDWRAILFLDGDAGKSGLIHGDELTALSS